MKLRTIMATIAVLAIVFGIGIFLHNRSNRFSALALSYGREAARLENGLELISQAEVQPLLDRVHWNDSVAEAYRQAASLPWKWGDPDPDKIICQCTYHAKLASAQPGP